MRVLLNHRFKIADATFDEKERIPFDDFVSWARTLNWWLPDALVAPQPGSSKRPTTWQARARAMATEIVRRDRLNGANPTKGDIAGDIERVSQRTVRKPLVARSRKQTSCATR